MLKHIGLSLCLCLMAMGLNSVFVGNSEAQPPAGQEAHSVTSGPGTLSDTNISTVQDRSTHRVLHAICGAVAYGDMAQRTSSATSNFLFRSCRGTP